MIKTIRTWWQDQLFRGVIKNSSYLFSSNTAAVILSMLQGILAARLLGVADYGILAATIIPFVSNIHRLLSFRMSEVVVKHLGTYLLEEKKKEAAALVKGTVFVETMTSGIAYVILLFVAPLAARWFAHDEQTTSLFMLYGIVLLFDFAFESSTGVLQATNCFNRLAINNLIQSLITAGIIVISFFAHGDVLAILYAYLIGKSFAGLAVAWMAYHQLNQRLGAGWWRVPMNAITNWNELIRFALTTNLHGTVNLIVRDSETLFISFLRSPAEAAYFRIAQGVINLVMLPIEPFIAPTYAEISRTIAQREYALTGQLLKRLSSVAGGWTLLAGGALALTGWWIIPFLYGQEYALAYPALCILLIGYGFANILNWNRPLLLALGMPGYPFQVSAYSGLVKTILTLLVVPLYGYLAEAIILTSYFLTTITTIVWRGRRELRQRMIITT